MLARHGSASAPTHASTPMRERAHEEKPMRGYDNASEFSRDEHEPARARCDFDMRIDTARAHDTRTRRDACMSVDDESMEHADRSVHRLAAGRMPRIVRSRMRRPDHGAPSTNRRIFISHARHGDRRMTWRAYR
ncbi:hypothetical protein [Ralstonia solanacearum]|uniref:hypothetical protein n=1 Tax=Ralstonia solanacearum TaxID=305 RepID=UPI0018D1747F|nr:hypothetical protein [Ralstonia solanacearum]